MDTYLQLLKEGQQDEWSDALNINPREALDIIPAAIYNKVTQITGKPNRIEVSKVTAKKGHLILYIEGPKDSVRLFFKIQIVGGHVMGDNKNIL